MHARTTTLQVHPDRLADAVRAVRDDVLVSQAALGGFLGMSMLLDRAAGRALVTSAWDDLGCLHSSGEARRLAVAVEGLLVGPPTARNWTIAVLHRRERTRPGAWARLAWMRGDAAQADVQVDVYRMLAVPVLDELEGFCSASLLVDRASGRGVSCVTYASRDALHLGREQAARMRRDAVALTGVEVERTAEMELAVARLRVPERV